jgi:hypothetical protein
MAMEGRKEDKMAGGVAWLMQEEAVVYIFHLQYLLHENFIIEELSPLSRNLHPPSVIDVCRARPR